MRPNKSKDYQVTQQPVNLPSADSLLSSAPTAKFEQPGANITGTLIEDPQATQQSDYETQEPAFWKDGRPKMQVVLRLADAAGEETRVFVKGRMLTSVKKATRVAGAPLRAGGEISITYTGDGEAKRGMHAPKLFDVVYDGPGQAAPGSPEPVAQPVQAQPQSPQMTAQQQQGDPWSATPQQAPLQPQQAPLQPQQPPLQTQQQPAPPPF